MAGEDASMHDLVLQTIREFPGIHFRGIVTELETSTSLVRYHLQDLLEQNDVRAVEVGGYTRYFPAETYREIAPEERGMLNVLRQERPLEIALALLEFGPMQHKDLLEVVGGSKGTLTYHINKLVDVGIVRRVRRGDDRGFHLRDEDELRDLLARYEPNPTVLSEVHDLWEDLFGGHRAGDG